MSIDVKCAKCGAQCGGDPNWTEADADAERERNWPGVRKEDCDVLCDECHEQFLTWFNGQPPVVKMEMTYQRQVEDEAAEAERKFQRELIKAMNKRLDSFFGL